MRINVNDHGIFPDTNELTDLWLWTDRNSSVPPPPADLAQLRHLKNIFDDFAAGSVRSSSQSMFIVSNSM